MNEILNFEVFWLSYVRMRKWEKSYLRILPFPHAASKDSATIYNRSVPQLISTATFLIVLAISGVMVINGQVQFGELTVIIMYTQRMFNPLSSIMLVIGQFQKAKVSMDRINEIVG